MNNYKLFYEKHSIYRDEGEWHDASIKASDDSEACLFAAERLFKIDSKSASSYVGNAYLISPDGRRLIINSNGIDTVIFDIGGVLAKGGHRGVIWEWLERNKTISPELIKEFRFGRFREQEWGAWKDYKIGACSHDDYWRRTLENTGLESRANEISKLVWDGFSQCQPESGTRFLQLLKERGYRLAVLSNHVKEWGWAVVEQLKLRNYCDPIIISADVGMKKPDDEIYAHTLKVVGRENAPQKCLFVDDKIENVLAARKNGMQAFHFKDKNGFGADKLFEDELHAYGILEKRLDDCV